jgi:hypothetical protein
VESFNIGFHNTGTFGAKLAIHDHRVKPLIQQNSILIHTGKHFRPHEHCRTFESDTTKVRSGVIS